MPRSASPGKAAAGKRREAQAINLRFLQIFVLTWLALTVLFLWVPGVQSTLRLTTAASLAVCLRLFGLAAATHGTLVTFPPAGQFEIITECTAIYIIPIFAAAVLAAPVSLRDKLLALLWGIPFLFAFNLLRLIILAFVLIHWPGAFNFIHDYLWQVLFAATVIVVWWIWCEMTLRKSGGSAGARPAAAVSLGGSPG